MSKPFPFTRLTPEQAEQDYPALFATFKAEFSWSGIALQSNYDQMIAAMVSIAVEATSYLSDIKKLQEFYGAREKAQ